VFFGGGVCWFLFSFELRGGGGGFCFVFVGRGGSGVLLVLFFGGFFFLIVFLVGGFFLAVQCKWKINYSVNKDVSSDCSFFPRIAIRASFPWRIFLR